MVKIKIPGQDRNDIVATSHPEPCPEFIPGLIQCSHPELDSGSTMVKIKIPGQARNDI